MDPLILAGLLTVVAKNLVEMVKHFANVGEDSTYAPTKGIYAVLAPVLLAVFAFIAENQGATIDLLGSLGVNVTDPTVAAILSGLLAGLVAPEAYDAQNLLKTKVQANDVSIRNVEANLATMSDPAA